MSAATKRMRSRAGALALAVSGFMLAGTLFAPSAQAAVTLNQTPLTSGNDDSYQVEMTPDGRYAVFSSYATNLVPGDTNGMMDIFLLDFGNNNAITRISPATANGHSFRPNISDDGRYVLFISPASNIVPDDTNGVADLFLHDRTTGTYERVNISSNGEQSDNAVVNGLAYVSTNGQYVSFSSYATNLVNDDTNGKTDGFVRDRFNGVTERISLTAAGQQFSGDAGAGAMSSDGRYVLFGAPNASNIRYVYIRDRLKNQVLGMDIYGNTNSGGAAMSRNGQWVLFGDRGSGDSSYVHLGMYSVANRATYSLPGLPYRGYTSAGNHASGINDTGKLLLTSTDGVFGNNIYSGHLGVVSSTGSYGNETCFTCIPNATGTAIATDAYAMSQWGNRVVFTGSKWEYSKTSSPQIGQVWRAEETAPKAELYVIGSAVTLLEGGAPGTYKLSLSVLPTADVTVNLVSDGQVTVSPSSLTFTPGDWNQPQTVTVEAVADGLYETAHATTVTHQLVSTDTRYNKVSEAAAVINLIDEDGAAPTVAISSPAVDGAMVGPNTEVTASAGDDGAILKVEFYVDGTLVSTDAQAPYTWKWNLTSLPDGTTHSVTAKAYDRAGNVTQSAPVSVVVDTHAPAVSITNPAVNGTVIGTVPVSADATDTVGVTKVEFYLDNVLKSTVTTAPYTWEWDTTKATNGSHTLTVKAYDAAGNTGTASRSVQVDLPPTVTLSAAALVRGTVTVNATAADANGVTKVEFYADDVLQSTDTASPFSWSWNTTAATNGDHVLTAKAYDAGGNVVTSAPVNTYVDNLPPVLAVTAPASGATVIGTIDVAADATDDKSVAKVEFYLDGTLKSTDTVAPFAWSWVTTTATNGSHTLMLKAHDTAGNITTANVPVVVDLPPTLSITAPLDGKAIGGTFSVVASATDAVGVTQVEFSVDDVLQHTITTPASPYTWAWDTTTFSNEPHKVTVAAYDAAGNMTVRSVTPKVDNEAPSLSITVPAAGTTVKGTVTVTPSVTDANGVAKVEFYIDDVLKSTVTASPYNWNWNTTTYTDGDHTVKLMAYDSVGNVSTATATVVVDTPPTVSISAPTANADVRGVVTIAAAAADVVGVEKVEFYVDSVLKGTVTTAPYTFDWDSATATNASHTLQARAYDTVGNVTASGTVTVKVDNQAPAASITAPGVSVRATVTVAATATDNTSVTRVEFYLDDVLQSTDTTSPYSWSWNTTAATNEDHTLAVKAYDPAGNMAAVTKVVNVDNMLPTAAVLAPAAGAVLTGTVEVSADASDNVGVTKVNFYVDNTLKSTVTTAPYVWNLDTLTVTNGTHSLRADAFDAAGNVGASPAVSVSVDLPPTVSLSLATLVRGTYTVNATATDANGVARVEFYVDEVLQATDSTSPYSWTWDTTTMTNELHTVTVKAYDAVNNVAVATRTTTVDNSAPVVTLTNPAEGATVIGTVAVTATAEDNRGVTKVEFYLDNTLQTTVTAAPYTWSWTTTGATNGSHTVTAKAYDQAGNVTAALANVTVDLPPTLTITAPAASAKVRGTVSVTANATDVFGVTKVEFLVDGVSQSEVTTAPYAWDWDTTAASNANHTITAKAYDASGNITTRAVTVTVDNLAPTLTIVSPAAGSTVKGTTTVTTTATDNVGVTKVEFYVDGVLKSTLTASPYNWSWNTTTYTDGDHTVTVKAYDQVGNTSELSVTVNVDTPPTVSLTAPTAGVHLRGTTAIAATASDVVGIAKVEFYVDSVLKGTAVAEPYAFDWDTTTATNATHSLQAKAHDTAGNITTSGAVSVTVDNQKPTAGITAPGATARGTVTVTASATDNATVARVEFYLDDVLQSTDTTSPYNWSWNTTTATNENHTLAVKVFDLAGNEAVASKVVNVDNELPLATVTGPAAGSVLIGTVSVTADATDNVGVTKVNFYVDNVLKSTATTAPYAWNWDTLTATNGAHTLKAEAFDAAGNAAFSPNVAVTVDLPPTVSLNLATLVRGTYTVSATATDGNAVTQVEFYVDDQLQNTDTASPFTWAWDTAAVTNGNHTVTVKAYDASNNVATATKTTTVDNEAPAAALTSPADGATVIGTVAVSATATDNRGVTKVDFYLDSTLQVSDTAAPYTWSWNTTTATNGAHTVTAKAYDQAGNVTDAVANVTVDLPPTLTITAPAASAKLSGSVTVSTTATDAVGVTKVEFYVDNVYQAEVTTAPYNWDWNTTSTGNGSRVVMAKAYDAAGNITSKTVTVTVDNLAPTLTITAPTDGATVKGSLAVNATATDTSGITKVEFYVDDVLQNTDTVSPYSWTWNTTTYTDGFHTVTAKAYDQAGNMSVSAVTVNVDTPPTLTITAPIAGAFLRGTVDVTADAADVVGVTKVEFLVDNVLKSTVTTAPYVWSWSTATATNAAHTVLVKAYDAAGNVTSKSVSVTVDNAVPTLSISAPANGATVRGTVSVTASASDTQGLAQVEFYLDDVLMSTDTASPYSWSWNTTGTANGSHTVKAIAVDRAGNTTIRTITVTVSN